MVTYNSIAFLHLNSLRIPPSTATPSSAGLAAFPPPSPPSNLACRKSPPRQKTLARHPTTWHPLYTCPHFRALFALINVVWLPQQRQRRRVYHSRTKKPEWDTKAPIRGSLGWHRGLLRQALPRHMQPPPFRVSGTYRAKSEWSYVARVSPTPISHSGTGFLEKPDACRTSRCLPAARERWLWVVEPLLVVVGHWGARY